MRLLMVSVLLSVLVTSAANFSGKWIIEEGGPGRTRPSTILILNQADSEVTGTISSPIDAGSASPVNTEILDGKVEGDTLTFYVWVGLDRPAKAFYKGTLSGDEIKFTVTGSTVTSGGLNGPSGVAVESDPRQVTAKRAK